MKDLYTRFNTSFFWNTIEAVLYQSLLALNYLALFLVGGASFFGKVGLLFSVIYLGVMIVNFGFNASVGAFFSRLVLHRSLFVKVLLQQIGLSFFIVLSMAMLFLWLPQKAIFFFAASSNTLVFILLSIFVAESFKTMVRSLLQLFFQAKSVALVEVSTMVCYLLFVWGGFAFFKSLTLFHIFFPMALFSWLSLLFLIGLIYKEYKKIPTNDTTPSTSTISRLFFKNRLFNFLNLLSHQLFSNNFLVPFFAVTIGFAAAGTLKLVSSVCNTLMTILRKTLGQPGGALLAQSKMLDSTAHHKTFQIVTKKTFFIAPLFIFFAVMMGAVFCYATSCSWQTIILLYLVFFVTISESLFIPYDKLLTTHEKADTLLMVNIFVIVGLYAILCYATLLGPMITLLSFLVVRTVSLSALYFWTRKFLSS